MIEDEVLLWAGLGFLALAVVTCAVWLAHAAWSTAAERRRDRRRPEVLAALAQAIQNGDLASATSSLAGLPRPERAGLLVEMAFTVAGEQRAQLDQLAIASGVMSKANRWALSRRWGRRLRAARLVALFGRDEEPAGEALLWDPNAEVRCQTTEWAAEHPTPRRIERLIEMLADPDPGCRFFAREALIRAGHPVLDPLRRRLESAGDGLPGTAGALDVATALATPAYAAAALRASRSTDPAVRVRAATLAAAVGGPQATSALEVLLADPADEVREAAARGLGRLGRWQSAGPVASLLDDPRWRTRHAAASALSRMGPTGELLLRRSARGRTPAADSARHALALEPADPAGKPRSEVAA